MTLLVFYLVLAIGVSFLCSLCEAALLTLTISDAEVMTKRGRGVGARLRRMKESIDRPLAAILTLNTIAHTVGAAGVGAQTSKVFENLSVGVTSGILTLLVLVLSEIIPKTIGATHAKRLAAPTVLIVQWMIWITYPIVLSLDAISRVLKGPTGHGGPSRQQIEVMAELARSAGSLEGTESDLMRNMLQLQTTRVSEVMTPRVVVKTAQIDDRVRSMVSHVDPIRFSRLPVVGDGPDDIRGLVLKAELQHAVIRGKGDRPLAEFVHPIEPIPAVATLLDAMEHFRKTGAHLFLVVDEFGGTAGVLTLEDVLESILGTEIVDEFDQVADMRELAMQLSGDDAAGAASGADAATTETEATVSPSSDSDGETDGSDDDTSRRSTGN